MHTFFSQIFPRKLKCALYTEPLVFTCNLHNNTRRQGERNQEKSWLSIIHHFSPRPSVIQFKSYKFTITIENQLHFTYIHTSFSGAPCGAFQ